MVAPPIANKRVNQDKERRPGNVKIGEQQVDDPASRSLAWMNSDVSPARGGRSPPPIRGF